MPAAAAPKQVDIYSALLADLASGALAPGQPVSAEKRCRRWITSCVPVGEALIRLEIDGVIERRNCVGTFVRRVDAEEISELYTLRSAVEQAVVRRVAEVATDRQLKELR